MPAGFTRSFREELTHLEEKRACCRLATIAGLVHTVGTFHIRGGSSDEERYELQLATTVQSAAKLAFSQFKAFGAEAELLTRREPRFRRRLLYELHLKGSPATIQVLNELGVLSDTFQLEPGITPRITKKGCCRRAFLRGCLIGAGSANAPQRESHLEMVVAHEALADDLQRMLEEMDFHPGVFQRRGSYVVYFKGREEVAGVLAQAGAHRAALALEEQSVLKDVRARANRVANCDAANLRRTSSAARRQLDAINLLRRTGRIRTLPPALQDMADLRQRYPYMTLTELAGEGDESLSRSAINHRLRRLVQEAEKGSGGRL
jgi:DNA-binding protein WhiA